MAAAYFALPSTLAANRVRCPSATNANPISSLTLLRPPNNVSHALQSFLAVISVCRPLNVSVANQVITSTTHCNVKAAQHFHSVSSAQTIPHVCSAQLVTICSTRNVCSAVVQFQVALVV